MFRVPLPRSTNARFWRVQAVQPGHQSRRLVSPSASLFTGIPASHNVERHSIPNLKWLFDTEIASGVLQTAMSAALNSRPDASLNQSSGTIPDLSLGSLNSGISTPARPGLRAPSASSGTTAPSSAPLSTPSPPTTSAFSKRKSDESTPAGRRYGLSGHEEDEDGDLLNTPGEKAWGDGPDTPMAGTRPKRTRSGASGAKGSNLTLRDQEKVRLPNF